MEIMAFFNNANSFISCFSYVNDSNINLTSIKNQAKENTNRSTINKVCETKSEIKK